MKIAIVNLITATVYPEKLCPPRFSYTQLATDADVNIVELAHAIADLNHEVTVYISDRFKPCHSIDRMMQNLSVRYVPTCLDQIFSSFIMPFTPPLYQELRSRDYDVIQCSDFFQWGTLLASLAHNKKKASMFIWQELDTYYQVLPARVLQEVYYKTIGRMVVEKLTGFIPRSMSARNHLWKIGLPRCKIYKVIPTGVNTEVFHPIKNSNVKEDFGVNDRPLLLAVGRLHPNKNFGFLINTMKKVVQREPDAYLIIKGNGPQKCTLETLIRVLKLDSNVKIISQHLSREEMVKLYNACDFLIIPSKIDLFPFVCLEALACGKPVISTFGKALKDLIGDGKAGVILENADENELSKCIVYLINNPDVVRKMGEAAFKRAQNKYSMTVVANEFIRIYERSLMD